MRVRVRRFEEIDLPPPEKPTYKSTFRAMAVAVVAAVVAAAGGGGGGGSRHRHRPLDGGAQLTPHLGVRERVMDGREENTNANTDDRQKEMRSDRQTDRQADRERELSARQTEGQLSTRGTDPDREREITGEEKCQPNPPLFSPSRSCGSDRLSARLVS